MIEPAISADDAEDMDEEIYAEETRGSKEEEFDVSVHALAGYANPQTMCVKGYIKKQPVSILIDFGSTDNFLDSKIARKLACSSTSCDKFEVKVVDGRSLACSAKCSDVEISMQGQHIRTDLFLLSLEGYDLVLGARWLRTLGDITWNFSKLVMRFTLDGKKVVIHGKGSGEVSTVSAHQMERILKKRPEVFLAQLCSINKSNSSNKNCSELEDLLSEFADIFETPQGLPPKPSHDHQIPLVPGSGPTNVRPYHYPYIQKTEIEKMVREMLAAGIIRSSISPHSSPVLLVWKKDGSWRMCVDYRVLNKTTVKDKYPIPVLEELLDELGGAQYFSKLDVRAGYYQIQVHEEDIQKTAFWTR